MSLTYGKPLMKVEEYVNVLKIAAMRRKMLYVSEKRPESLIIANTGKPLRLPRVRAKTWFLPKNKGGGASLVIIVSTYITMVLIRV